MKRLTLLTLVLMAMALAASAQSMMSSKSESTDTSSMMAPADSSMTASSNSMKGSADTMMAPADSSMASSSGSMMADDMSYAALKKEGRLADVKMGMQLRAATSTGMKVMYKNLMSTEALAAKGPTVLFFSADWSPYCQAELKDINANGSKLGKVNIVVVDFDNSADLKSKYGVTTQDTYVQIGAMGEKLAIWNGGGVDGILTNLKSAM